MENMDCSFSDSQACIFTVNQHGWGKCSLATPVHENADRVFMVIWGCIFTVNQHGWNKIKRSHPRA